MVITYQNGEIPEIEAVRKIKAGTPLSEFGGVSDLMAIAVMNTDRTKWTDVPDYAYTARVARKAVLCDFRALNRVPDDIKNRCAREFSTYLVRLTRKEREEYTDIFSAQSDSFIKKMLKDYPESYDALSDAQKNRFGRFRGNHRQKRTSGTALPLHDMPGFGIVTDGENEVLTPQSYLGLPKEKMTKDALDGLLEQEVLFPDNFIMKLLTPNRNAAFYKKLDDKERSAFWEAQKLPWITKEVVLEVAARHPEASIGTPQYLTKDGVSAFFRKWELLLSSDEIAKYFMKFPEEMLTEEDAAFVTLSTALLSHAPNILKSSGFADRYIRNHPGEIVKLPAQYQTRGRILADGVPLRKGELGFIADPELRALIAESLTAPERPKPQKAGDSKNQPYRKRRFYRRGKGAAKHGRGYVESRPQASSAPQHTGKATP